MNVIIIILIVYVGICVLLGIIQYIIRPKPSKKLTMTEYYRYYQTKTWKTHKTPEFIDNEINDIQLKERIMILDETIVKYNQLLDNLNSQYKNTTDNKKRSIILSKQILTMEKLNRALEKREKLDY